MRLWRQLIDTDKNIYGETFTSFTLNGFHAHPMWLECLLLNRQNSYTIRVNESLLVSDILPLRVILFSESWVSAVFKCVLFGWSHTFNLCGGIISWPLGNRRFKGKPIRVRVKRSANERQVTVSPLDRSIVKCLILETFYTRHSFHSLILLADTNNTFFVLITNLASVRLILLVSTWRSGEAE